MRPAWSIEHVPAQPELFRETLPNKIKDRDTHRGTGSHRERGRVRETERRTKRKTEKRRHKERNRSRDREGDRKTNRYKQRQREI